MTALVPKTDPGRDKLLRRAMIIGAALAVLCQLLPPGHRELCSTVVKLATLTCGG